MVLTRGKLASLDFMSRACRKQKPSASQKLNFPFHVCKNHRETADFGTVIPVTQLSRSLATPQIRKVQGDEEGGGVRSNPPGMASSCLGTHPLLCVPKTPPKTPVPRHQRRWMGPPEENCCGWGFTMNFMGAQCPVEHLHIHQPGSFSKEDISPSLRPFTLPNHDVSGCRRPQNRPRFAHIPEPPSPLVLGYLLSSVSLAASVREF